MRVPFWCIRNKRLASFFDPKPPFTQLNKTFTHVHDTLMFLVSTHSIVDVLHCLQCPLSVGFLSACFRQEPCSRALFELHPLLSCNKGWSKQCFLNCMGCVWLIFALLITFLLFSVNENKTPQHLLKERERERERWKATNAPATQHLFWFSSCVRGEVQLKAKMSLTQRKNSQMETTTRKRSSTLNVDEWTTTWKLNCSLWTL